MPSDRMGIARTVKPRKPVTNAAERPIYAVVDDTACNEQGETMPVEVLLRELRTVPPSLIVTANESAAFLKSVQDMYGHNPNFNFRVTPIEREIFTPRQTGEHNKQTMSLTSVAYFGWQKEKRGRSNTIRNRYHLLLDPVTFSGEWLKERTLAAYLQWTCEIREFCIEQNWNLRATQGGTARQALQDTRFYPDARRKVPRATNERVRKVLPGNHYQLSENIGLDRTYSADYLDQSRCHHYHAINAKLPDANHLFSYGNFHGLDGEWISRPDRIASFVQGFAGLYYGTIYWPLSTRKNTSLIPQFLKDWEPGKRIYFYSEDLPLFEALRIRVTSLIAAWGSKQHDVGLAAYAKWAIEELGDNPPAWKKPLLLAPYGALATRARKHQTAFHRSNNGRPTILRSKSGVTLPVNVHETTKESEPSTNNILHRALIEAANRTETLLYAQYLESLGYHVLCIYVDGILVEQDEDLSRPLLAPWRLDRTLTDLRFLSESQFVSSELTKLPGVTGAQRKQLALRSGGSGLGTAADMKARAERADDRSWQDALRAVSRQRRNRESQKVS